MNITVGIADDQQLFLKSLSALIGGFPDFETILEALNGRDLLHTLSVSDVHPDILLVDVNMPVMDGPDVCLAISDKYPAIKMVALSMKDDDFSIIRMIRAGCCAYLLKDIHPLILERALREVNTEGYYNADLSNMHSRRLITKAGEAEKNRLTDKENIFLQLACSEFTYKEIAAKMYLSERTIDGYRESLFEKLHVKSRVGMVLEALRRNIVSL